MRTWAACIALAFPVAGAVWLGVPFWLALVAAFVFLFAVIGNGKARRWGRVALLPVLALAAGTVVLHAAAGPVPAGPPVVAFSGGQYSSYGTPTVTVDVANNGSGPVTVHQITVRFVNIMDGAVITDVTEPAGVTVPAGQGRVLTYSAPRQVQNVPLTDAHVSVTVTGWS